MFGVLVGEVLSCNNEVFVVLVEVCLFMVKMVVDGELV